MSHVRTDIRNAVIALLTPVSALGGNVYPDQDYVLSEAQLPAAKVRTSDTAEPLTVTTPLIYQRNVVVSVELVAKAGSGLSTLLDDLAEAVEAALNVPITLGGQQVYLFYQGTDEPDRDADGDRPVGSITLNYLVSI